MSALDDILPPDPGAGTVKARGDLDLGEPSAAVQVLIDALPDWARELLTHPADDRSKASHHMLSVLCELGLRDADVMALMGRHTATVDKYGGDSAVVENDLAKVRSRHPHAGKQCFDAGCSSTPRWQIDKKNREEAEREWFESSTENASSGERGTTSPDDDEADSWEPVDTGPAWRGEKVKPIATVMPRSDGVALFVPGINYLFGDSGDGKSLVLLIAALMVLRTGGQVVWVTYEDANEDLLIERIKMLGASDDERQRLHIVIPQAGLSNGIDRLTKLIERTSAELCVLDSVGEAMAVGGVNEDKDAEVGPWFRKTIRRLHDHIPSLTIVPIDHSTKSKDNPLFPSGSKRKRAFMTGRGYLLNVRTSFAVGEIGYVQLVVSKDRGGTFKRGDVAGEIKLDATVSPYVFEVTAPRSGDSYNPKVKRRAAADRVREVLGESAVAMTAEQVARIANGPDRRRDGEADLSPGTVRNTLTKLAKEAVIVRETAPETVPGSYPPSVWRMTHHESDRLGDDG